MIRDRVACGDGDRVVLVVGAATWGGNITLKATRGMSGIYMHDL